MRSPLAAVLWVNYNSRKIQDIVMDSLNAVADINYDNYVLIAVDNASTDGSWEAILEKIEALRRRGLRALTLRLGLNAGFTGGMNAAYRAALRLGAAYVAVLNNDAVLEPESLPALIEVMEQCRSIGAAQGVILDYTGSTVQTAGNFHSELLTTHMAFQGEAPGAVPGKPYPITYASGAYAVYRVKAVRKTRGERLFDNWVFAYFDDNALGLTLWGAGFASVTVPIVAGRHYEGATFRRQGPRRIYFTSRGHLLAAHVTGTRYLPAIESSYARRAAAAVLGELTGRLPRGSGAAYLAALRDARRMHHRVSGRHYIGRGYRRAPLLRVAPREAAMYILQGALVMSRLAKRLHTLLRKLPGLDELCGNEARATL